MGKVILLCGKICSGKTHYAARLLSETGGVLLSCDEIMFGLDLDRLLDYLEDVHAVMIPKIQHYLYKRRRKLSLPVRMWFWTLVFGAVRSVKLCPNIL